MHSGLRISAGFIVAVLVVVFGILAVSVGTAYASAQDRCLSYPQTYPFMSTRFHAGACQFRENDGWSTFSPSHS